LQKALPNTSGWAMDPVATQQDVPYSSAHNHADGLPAQTVPMMARQTGISLANAL
jgi:hypothetical protein